MGVGDRRRVGVGARAGDRGDVAHIERHADLGGELGFGSGLGDDELPGGEDDLAGRPRLDLVRIEVAAHRDGHAVDLDHGRMGLAVDDEPRGAVRRRGGEMGGDGRFEPKLRHVEHLLLADGRDREIRQVGRVFAGMVDGERPAVLAAGVGAHADARVAERLALVEVRRGVGVGRDLDPLGEHAAEMPRGRGGGLERRGVVRLRHIGVDELDQLVVDVAEGVGLDEIGAALGERCLDAVHPEPGGDREVSSPEV